MLRKKTLIQSVMIILFLFVPMFLGAVNINQIINIKNDGSGTMNFTYMEKQDIVKGKNFLIGNLPFTKEKVAEYFKAPNSYIQLSKIEQNQKDNTLTEVTVIISFTDINKLSEAKALNNMSLTSSATDSGLVLKNVVNPEFVKTNSVNQIFYVLNSESNVKSSNGKIADKSVSFFRGKEYVDGKTAMNFIVTIESEGGNSASNNEEDNDKPCGLFGLELPLIMFAGLAFSYNRKRFKK